MKKIFLVAVLVALVANANAQWLDFRNNDERYGIGLQLGMVGRGADYTGFGGGVSLNVYGIFIDYTQVGPEHKYDNHVTNTMYDDSVSCHLNVGYQIPVLPWLRIMPIVGYFQTNAGLTDATSVNIETDGETAQIYHDYTVTDGTRQHKFNFGGGLVVTPFKYVDIYAVYTRYSIYGGISFNLGTFIND